MVSNRRVGARARLGALLAAAGAASLTAALVVTAPAGAAPSPGTTPPARPVTSTKPMPTPTSIDQAQKQKDAAEQALVRLNARIAQETQQLSVLSAAADRARQRYSAQLLAQQAAARQEQAAKAAEQQAQADYAGAHQRFIDMITASYVYGTSPDASSAAALFTAGSPEDVLGTLDMLRVADHSQASVVDDLSSVLARRSAAERSRSAALARQRAITAQLAGDKQAAEQTLAAAQQALATLQSDIATAKQGRLAAIIALSKFLGGWSMADPAQAAALNAHYREMAARAARAPLPKNPGHWTPALGRYAANRALAWIGTPYAWAGGNAAGPTRGVCSGNGAEHDCQIIGFDCSGLALYGWAPFQAMPHLASSQYVVTGSVHPSVQQLLPGDLVFWSDGNTVAGIHHVAVYVGDGNVVQAPQSGDIVRITPLASVDSGYFGATRPMT